MPVRKDVPVKEKYRLWMGYLKRSEKYEKFCEYLREKEKDRDILEIMEDPSHETNTPIKDLCFKLDDQKYFEETQQKLKDNEAMNILHLCRVFGCWGDIFNKNFNFDHWCRFHFYLLTNVYDLSPEMRKLKKYHKYLANGKTPKQKWLEDDAPLWATDIREWISQELDPGEDGCLINIVGISQWNIDDILKEVKKIVIKRHKENSSRANLMYVTERFWFDQVRKYLEVYNKVESLKSKKLSWEKITKEFYPRLAKRLEEKDLAFKVEGARILNRFDNHERRLKMEYAKAKQIIENVEKGQFPGKY